MAAPGVLGTPPVLAAMLADLNPEMTHVYLSLLVPQDGPVFVAPLRVPVASCVLYVVYVILPQAKEKDGA